MRNPRLIDLTNQQFGDWTVRQKVGNTPKGAALWLCICACGREGTVSGTDLRLGKSVRCRSCAVSATSTRHGGTGTRLHGIWKSMHQRCRNKSNPHYGALGITVCAEWGSFETFRDWALGNGYRDDLSIDRINSAEGYSPGNCTWANAQAQSVNRRFVRKNPDGVPWSAIAISNGLTLGAYRSRVSDGWPDEAAATTPPGGRRPR